MIICRFLNQGRANHGIIKNGCVSLIEGDLFGRWKETDRTFPLEKVRLLPPVLPSKIIAVGVNYKDHASEMDHRLPKNPIIFMKPGTSVIGPYQSIDLPAMSSRVDYEAELAVVIKKKCKDVSIHTAHDYILGATCFNDVTARDLQQIDGQWTRAKSFDTFSPIGPWIQTEVEYNACDIKLILNGRVMQQSNTSNLIFNVEHLISFISQVMTLYPGDVVATGTPSGIGPLKSGDMVQVQIEGIGTLTNYVK